MTKSHFSLVSAGLLTNPHVPYMAHRIRKDIGKKGDFEIEEKPTVGNAV